MQYDREKGYKTEVYLFNPKGELSPDCQTNKELVEMAEEVTFHEISTQFVPPTLTPDHLVIDGLFGSGLNKPLSGGFAAVVKYINSSPAMVVAIDIPSGLMGEENTFNVKNNIIRADVTFSLQLPKLAFLFAENTEYVGEWDLLNIGLSEEGIEETKTNYEMLELEDIRSLIKPRQQFAHKGNFGHALLIAGSKGMAGAYNHNVIKIAEKEALSDNKNMLFVVGQVGRKYFEKKNIPIDIDFKYTAQNPNVNRARVISEKIVELFREKKLDEVYIVYTRMVNSVTFDAEIKQLLPLKKVKFERTDESNKYGTCSFEPSMNAVFDHIIPNYVSGFVYGALVESYCSEHNARMMAMQTATDAAKDMLRSLGIEYNRARQAAITQEITEVIAGAKAQKMKED